MSYISFNGKIIAADAPALQVNNRGYRYGDGLFETMKVANGKIKLANYHFERLFKSLALLQMEAPSLFKEEIILSEIEVLCKKNKCEGHARVRLSVFRGNGGLYDGEKKLQYIIESWPLTISIGLINENGLVIDVYPDARKTCDVFANIKSASFLPYNMAAQYAKANKLNDCLVLNQYHNIADSTIANVFLIKNGEIITPALTEGCVAGVMRSFLIQQLQQNDYLLKEQPVTIAQLLEADEIFLTNAIRGIQWVKQCGDKMLGNTKTLEIYSRFH